MKNANLWKKNFFVERYVGEMNEDFFLTSISEKIAYRYGTHAEGVTVVACEESEREDVCNK